MSETKLYGKSKESKYILRSIMSFRKSCRLRDNVEKYCRAGQATDDSMGVCISCFIPKATNTHSEYVIRIAFPLQRRLRELTLPILLFHFVSIPI